jgi:hypothetical protein
MRLFGLLGLLATTLLTSAACGSSAAQGAATDVLYVGGPSDSADSGAAPSDPCAELGSLDRQVALDGLWAARWRARTAGSSWGDPQDLGQVAVPGWLLPFERFPSKDEDVELTYTRPLEWPAGWSCATEAAGFRALVELDSADYVSAAPTPSSAVHENSACCPPWRMQ